MLLVLVSQISLLISVTFDMTETAEFLPIKMLYFKVGPLLLSGEFLSFAHHLVKFTLDFRVLRQRQLVCQLI